MNPSSNNPTYTKPLIQLTTVSSINFMVCILLASPSIIKNFSKCPFACINSYSLTVPLLFSFAILLLFFVYVQCLLQLRKDKVELLKLQFVKKTGESKCLIKTTIYFYLTSSLTESLPFLQFDVTSFWFTLPNVMLLRLSNRIFHFKYSCDQNKRTQQAETSRSHLHFIKSLKKIKK